MRPWLASLVRGHAIELALALGLGYAAAVLAADVAGVVVNILAQHIGRVPFGEDGTVLGLLDLFTSPYYLYFNVGGTIVVFGQALSGALALGLVALLAFFVVRQRARELNACPFCASRIPHASTHCAYCGSSIEPERA